MEANHDNENPGAVGLASVVLVDADLQALVQSLEQAVGEREITSENVLMICISAMRLVESTQTAKGNKKTLAVNALTHVLQQKNVGADVLALIPSFIQMAFDLEKGNISATHAEDLAVNCCLVFLQNLARRRK